MENINEKDTSVIPQGPYCYTYVDGKFSPCPYWSKVMNAPEQYDGYCSFLEKGDLDLAREGEYRNMKTGEIVKGSDLPFPVSLLWDQVKECRINDEMYDDENDD